ncbi:MAG: protease modulator HflC [Candidatus Aminicenantes bacterium]|nr:protease modulator HflC [Candidatus Aminicenantes bacterium]NIM82237.1 protease modulator HflC [Candidatus Aminicenantes bacterium]NIN20650.1 protease modulator HflC [Candidatus Aminicenantes bacterium]NIN44429.1 protease modulator HflC [Candidatus Aminicenantes bacterium]NIN87248.1 protease modulator HflC [Candidatus Aminicenantes bacterium]
MKKTKGIIIAVVVFVILFLILGPYFIVEEGEQGVVIRFGRITRMETEAGLKFKVPLVDQVRYYPKKIQSWDGEAQLYPTEENQYIWVDITARWQIQDPKVFYERLGEIDSAQQRLDQVINSSARDVIAVHSLREAVRNSNRINEIERKDVYSGQTGAVEKGEIASTVRTFTKVTYEPIKKGREKLSDAMLTAARKMTPEYGIKLIDVVVRQIKYSDAITQNVYQQMIKERNQIAQAFRSDGEGEKAKWLGKMEKERLSIRSEAEKKAKEIKAKADAEALDIRNKAYSQSPEFAEFWMALKQYEKLLPNMKKILTTDPEFFKYLYKKGGR